MIAVIAEDSKFFAVTLKGVHNFAPIAGDNVQYCISQW